VRRSWTGREGSALVWRPVGDVRSKGDELDGEDEVTCSVVRGEEAERAQMRASR